MKEYTINLDIVINAKNVDEACDKLAELINHQYKYIIGEINNCDPESK